MHAGIADLVDPIFNAGISLRERLDAGEPLEWDRERVALVQLLTALQKDDDPIAGIFNDNEGDEALAFDFSVPDDPEERNRLTRATIRFALTCWLDEFLGAHATWGPRWRQQPLGAGFSDSPDTFGKFWVEARYAQTRNDLDALEVMYWCAMLGYRGAWRTTPEQLATWAQRVRELLAQSDIPWAMPASLAPIAHHATMPSDGAYRSMLFSVGLAFALTAPLVALIAWRFSQV